MKRLIYLMVMMSVAFVGCRRYDVADCPEVEQETVTLRFSVPVSSVSAPSVRDLADGMEDAVNNVQVFIFGSQGQIQNYGSVDGNVLSLTGTVGRKCFAALVNAPLCSDVRCVDDLYALVSDFGDNSPGNFVMCGMVEEDVTSSMSVEIPVGRLVAKVSLVEVENRMELLQHQRMDFVVEEVFLMNASAQCGYFDSSLPEDVVVPYGEVRSGELLYDDMEDVRLPYGQAVGCGSFLYCYPDRSEESPTYLVVAARLDDVRYYYPVRLPVLESNKRYDISLSVTRPGSQSPEVPVTKENAEISVEVSDWKEKIDINETI